MGNRTHRIGWAGNILSRSEGNSNFAYLTIAAAVAVGGIGSFQAIGESSGMLIDEQVHSDAVAAAGVDDMPAGDGNHGVTLGGSFAAAGGEPDPALCEELHLNGTGCDAYLSGEGIDCENTEAGYQSQCIGFLAGGGSVMGDPDAENENFDPEEYAELLERIEELEDDNCSGFGCFGKGFGDIGLSIGNWAQDRWEGAKDLASAAWSTTASLASSAWGWTTNFVTNTIPHWAGSAWDATYENVLAPTGRFFSQTIPRWAGNVWNGAKDLASAAWSTTASLASSAWGWTTNFVTNTIPHWADVAWDATYENVLAPTGRFLKAVPGFVEDVVYTGIVGVVGVVGGIAQLTWTGIKAVPGLVDTAWDATYENVLAPTGRFFRNAPGWVYDNALTPVGHFFRDGWNATYENVLAPTGRFFKNIPGWTEDNVIEPAVGHVQDEVEEAQDRIDNTLGDIGDTLSAGYNEARDAADTGTEIKNTLGDSISVELFELADNFDGSAADASEARSATHEWAQSMSDSELEAAIEELEDLAADEDQAGKTIEFAEIMIDALDARLNPPEPVQYQGGIPQ